MPAFEVEMDLLVYTRVRVRVEAENKDGALDAACEILPNRGADEGWSAKVQVKAPEGVEIKVLRAYHFEQTSGGEKVRPAKVR
jgi:hypothetical protein